MMWVRMIISFLIATIDQSSVEVDAVGGCSTGDALDVVTCVRPAAVDFDKLLLDPYSQSQCAEAFILIDSHLRNTIRDNNLKNNLKEVKKLLAKEEEAMKHNAFAFFKKKLCLSEKLRSKNKWIMLTALNILTSLHSAPEPAYQCFIHATQNLADNNRVAGDPIGRRSRNDTDLLPRIDSLIFDVARHRAELCLPRYKHQLAQMSYRLHDDEFVVMNNYFIRLIESRMQQKHFAYGRLDSIFSELPEEAVSFVKKMPHAFEKDDIRIALGIFNNQGGSSSDVPGEGADWRIHSFNRFLRRPCLRYIDKLSNIMESFDFYLRLKRFLPGAILRSSVYDRDISKLRAYFLMCTKLVKEESRFVDIVQTIEPRRSPS